MLASFCNYLSHSSILPSEYNNNRDALDGEDVSRSPVYLRSIYKILNKSVDYSIVLNSLLQLEETVLNQFKKNVKLQNVEHIPAFLFFLFLHLLLRLFQLQDPFIKRQLPFERITHVIFDTKPMSFSSIELILNHSSTCFDVLIDLLGLFLGNDLINFSLQDLKN